MAARDVVERHQQCMASLDVAGQLALYADDAVYEAPFAPPGAPHRFEGRAAVREMLLGTERRMHEAGLRPASRQAPPLVHETLDPEVLVVERTASIEHVDSGERFDLPYIQVYRVREGEIVSFRDYFTPITAGMKLVTP